MPIKIKESSTGITNVEWKTKVKHLAGKLGTDFILERCHPKSSYTVECDLDGELIRLTNSSYYKVQLYLSWISSSTDRATNIHHRPRTIWASFNQCSKFKLLKETGSSKTKRKWISPKISIDTNVGSNLQAEGQTFNLSLWFEFETFTRGQVNALTSLTDYLYVQQSKCDVHFCFGGGQQIGGHRNILSARSAVFKAMFQHDMKENKTGQVDIQDIELDIFDQLLYYIYSGRLCAQLSVNNAMSLFVAANKYEIADLKKECTAFLLSSIEVNNVISLMAWSHLYSVNPVKEAALMFAAQHGKEICQLDDWLSLTKNYPELTVMATRRMMK